MQKIFKPNTESEYRERLLKAFPKDLCIDVKKVMDILPFENNKVELSNGKIHEADILIHPTEHTVIVDNETLTIPYRLYFNEPIPESEQALTDRQKEILNCIFLRHHNGYLREKRLNLLSNNSEKWTIPYITQLIGEYVYELLPIVDLKINESTLDFYAEFRAENPKYWQQTESRMISYWNEYNRCEFPKLKEYIGFEIVNRIKKRTHNSTYK